jgi:hydroxyacylglutathione hydrolase
MRVLRAIALALLLAFGLLLVVSCQAGTPTAKPEASSDVKGYKDVTVEQAKDMLAKGGITVLDVRTPEEYAEGHIQNSKLLPLQELQQRADTELPKDHPIVVYCQTGVRSAQASKILADLGFGEVYNTLGGFQAWKSAGGAIVK